LEFNVPFQHKYGYIRDESNLVEIQQRLQCGPMPNVMVALPTTRGIVCSTPQHLADVQY